MLTRRTSCYMEGGQRRTPRQLVGYQTDVTAGISMRVRGNKEQTEKSGNCLVHVSYEILLLLYSSTAVNTSARHNNSCSSSRGSTRMSTAVDFVAYLLPQHKKRKEHYTGIPNVFFPFREPSLLLLYSSRSYRLCECPGYDSFCLCGYGL